MLQMMNVASFALEVFHDDPVQWNFSGLGQNIVSFMRNGMSALPNEPL
jgi:hypothetical protein